MKRSLFRRIAGSLLFLITLLAAVWIICCSAASFISPLRVKYLALFTITAPFAIGVNVLLLLMWLFFAHRKWRCVVPLLALGFSYHLIGVTFGLHPFGHNDMTAGEQRLKVMNWNVHGLGIFDKPADRTTDDKIVAQIQKEGADVLCLHEFYTVHNNALKPYSTALMQACGYKEYRFRYDNTLGLKIYLGTAIFSRYPISNFQSHALHLRADGWEDVHLLQCDVSLPNGKIVRLFATHLQSFLLSDNDKSFLEEVSKRDTTIKASRSRSFVVKFGDAYQKRARQADSAAAIIAQSPYPVILCGDFNDLPASYAYERMRGNLCDAFADGGFGIGHTYNLLSPTLRIDYIFYNAAAMKLVGFSSPRTTLSDHNPVIANFDISSGK